MNGRRCIAVLATLLGLLSQLAAIGVSAHAADPPCGIGVAGAQHQLVTRGVCYDNESHSPSVGTNAPPTRTIACGRPSAGFNAAWNAVCGTPVACMVTGPGSNQPTPTGAFATQTRTGAGWGPPVVWCPGDVAAAPALAAIREQVVRLLPRVRIGSAWTTTALVNAQTVLWADTAPDRDLGAVTIVGAAVRLRVGFDHANWDFGDGTSDTTSAPGKAYDPVGDACRTAQCPDYYGHTYRHTGQPVIALTVTWRAQFSIDGSDWTDLPAPLTGPVDHHQLTVKQARGILIPNP